MKKILVVGGGPGGYVAAIKAAQMGAQAHIVERREFGGTCLNVGCIPTKALLRSALFYKHVKDGDVAGVKAERVTLDWAEAQAHKQAVVNRLVGGVGGLLKANKVAVHKGEAAFAAPGVVTVDGKAPPQLANPDAVIVASGSVPAPLAFPGADLPAVIDSTGALALAKLPRSVCIVGGGVIGVEFASVFASAGARVAIVELLPEILPSVDAGIARMARVALERAGVRVLTGAKLAAVRQGGADEASVEVEAGGGRLTLAAEKVLVGVGRKPDTAALALEKAGVGTVRGAIKVDGNFETGARGVFAIGDCNAQVMLAHAASAQGEAAVEYILTGRHHYDPRIIPSCIYTEPEIATVGLSLGQARAQGFDAVEGLFDLAGNGKAMIDGGGPGVVKVVADRRLGEVLGVHMIGPHVTEMIAEAVAVMEAEGLVEDLLRTVHPHPTVSEAVGEAARAVFGNAIHWPPRS
ncbi:MAG: dihydrolipoyl dehydrogenase [Acidobacteriota bacterium]|jgi:dihydrolipoamide dehydrogenase|nr:dihydrolipoyl dehydrogenase [Acidobacteriota bacterium]